jgi:hypothetical protein
VTRRSFGVSLSGATEVRASDGEVRQVGPGTVVPAEDVTGRGHVTHGVGDVECLALFILLPN